MAPHIPSTQNMMHVQWQPLAAKQDTNNNNDRQLYNKSNVRQQQRLQIIPCPAMKVLKLVSRVLPKGHLENKKPS